MIQEIPLDHHDSRFFTKQLVATSSVLGTFGPIEILTQYLFLQEQARRCNDIDNLQVFEDHANSDRPNFWIIEDNQVVTALFPEGY
ncbi:MAG: hypothetical protein KJ970_18540 [Candidatus Eisenbacteria bacterium]|uniref:Uncharacterized protein n=1 Tax=Eiseniibacteriota bacterium TaxID=2212470 RepID=A0A948W8Q2_UNCEI|nr:hypothetical protein [Candidatus Eisenbacteria bacterium]